MRGNCIYAALYHLRVERESIIHLLARKSPINASTLKDAFIADQIEQLKDVQSNTRASFDNAVNCIHRVMHNSMTRKICTVTW
jgi:hypothetical protein